MLAMLASLLSGLWASATERHSTNIESFVDLQTIADCTDQQPVSAAAGNKSARNNITDCSVAEIYKQQRSTCFVYGTK